MIINRLADGSGFEKLKICSISPRGRKICDRTCERSGYQRDIGRSSILTISSFIRKLLSVQLKYSDDVSES
ncbi:hypothetical protein P689_122128 [Candidatus Riesia pediculischaeffi PTSU]|uniref:Uncharacterized protein n=1 Tax=Candidatus Riesia pediculischaeffi PTSU TaxID=1401651 RepID=A0A0C1V695_9ENTR|nr:hypothetical protein P689_122128 [Candidatus Riesia pediculischaeffi PTSU]